MPSIELDATQLDYVERGSGEAVLLVHGSQSDRRTWSGQLARFSERYRTVAYSRRYHWPNESIAADADYAMLEHVADLAAVIDKLGIGPVQLVGHSYGAFLCLLLAIRHPERVRSLVLAEPPVLTLFCSNRPRPTEILRLLFTRPRTALAIIKFGAGGVAPATAALERGDRQRALEALGCAVLGRKPFEALSKERLEQARANLIDAELLGSGFAPIRSEEVRSVDRPALLLCGALSPRLFHRFADRLEQLLPRCERDEIPDASHLMHEDNPSAFDDKVLGFLSRHEAG